MQVNDILIRRQRAVSVHGEGVRDFFTLHRVSRREQIAGPWADEQFAIEKARELATEAGSDVWLESAAAPAEFHSVPD